MSAYIDWEELTKMYNSMYKTNFNNSKEMLVKLYKSKPLRELEKLLGVSVGALSDKFKKEKIKTNPKGGPNNVCKKTMLLSIPRICLEQMTTKYISHILTINEAYARVMGKRHNRNFKDYIHC